MKKLLAALILVLLIAGGGFWSLYSGFGLDEAKDAARQVMTSQKKQTLADLEKRAKAGEKAAQLKLAKVYTEGELTSQDYQKAATWYYQAAKQGDPQAQYEIARMYEQGRGLKQDNFRAAEWYRLAAGPGRNADAQFKLGQMYSSGRGVPNDYDEAIRLFGLSANQGHPGAQFLLGAMNEEGWGRRRDLVKAYKWYTLALEREAEVRAINTQYDPFASRAGIEAKMNRAQIEEALAAAAAWKKARGK